MLHPDYQYTPKLIYSICYLIAQEVYPVVLGSRILGGGALKGGMPLYKYVPNRLLTFVQNIMLWQKLSEYHIGYRGFSREVLEKINYVDNDDGFIFDNQMLSQIIMAGYDIGEISCPTKYFEDASSINLPLSILYGIGVLKTSLMHVFHQLGICQYDLYRQN